MTRAEELLQLYEATLHRIISFRGGRRNVVKTCGPGYRKVGTSCKRMSTAQRYNISLGRKHAIRKNRSRQGVIQRKRLRSLSRRSASSY